MSRLVSLCNLFGSIWAPMSNMDNVGNVTELRWKGIVNYIWLLAQPEARSDGLDSFPSKSCEWQLGETCASK